MRKTASTTTQDSWASTLSDYILQRRQQTKLAYTHNQWQTPANSSSNSAMDTHQYAQQASVLMFANQDEWLFKIVFIALATQLEEGHTVLTLTGVTPPTDKSATSTTGKVNGKQASLYGWQQALIAPLAAPLFAMIDASNFANTTYRSSNTMFFQLNQLWQQGSQLWAQTAVSSHDKIILAKRLEAVQQLYTLLQNINTPSSAVGAGNAVRAVGAEPDPSIASFDRFIALIKHNPLLSQFDRKNSLSNIKQQIYYQNNNPIIYTISNHQQQQTLTFWLHRTWQAEYNLTKTVHHILQSKVKPLPINIPASLNEQQVAAIHVANNNAFSIITGGPGTGKTYTVAQLVIALQQVQQAEVNASTKADVKIAGKGRRTKFSTDSASLALAAPTGKAAQRMQESLQAALNAANVNMNLQDAKTIHRLLGIGQNGRPRYHADNPLGEDIIIVDEASMLGVELANHLVSAIKPQARLILLGDANQLAAVDAGAVLADLCHIPSLQPVHVTLTDSRRFGADSSIGQLAQQINQPKVNMATIWQLLRQEAGLAFHSVTANRNDPVNNLENEPVNTPLSPLLSPQISSQHSKEGLNLQTENRLSHQKILNALCLNYQDYLNQIQIILNNVSLPSKLSAGQNVDNVDEDNLNGYDTDFTINATTKSNKTITINELMATFNQFRILTAGHHGDWGDHNLNNYLTQWHKSELQLPLGKSPWFHGRPVMVLQNNYELGLFNGDIGICLQTSRGLEVFFDTKTQGIAVNLLNDDVIATAYAMTIHKSQGSEFDHVAITFDHTNARLLSKELIYTAVTRAKTQMTIYSTKRALEIAITTPTLRQTGLGLQFTALQGCHDKMLKTL